MSSEQVGLILTLSGVGIILWLCFAIHFYFGLFVLAVLLVIVGIAMVD